MLNFTGSLKVYLAVEPVDLRKGFGGLYGLTQTVLGQDPCSGGLFVFTNQSRTRLKILYFDGTGLWLMTKRLEKGTFHWPRDVAGKEGSLCLSPEALQLILDGVDLRAGTLRPWYRR